MKDTVPPPPRGIVVEDGSMLGRELSAKLSNENEIEDVIETAIDKAAKKHHMRDSTVMLLGVLGLLFGAAGIYVPIELHKRQLQRETEQSEESSVVIRNGPTLPTLVTEAPMHLGTNFVGMLQLWSDGAVKWRK